jgi:hypothetical protein
MKRGLLLLETTRCNVDVRHNENAITGKLGYVFREAWICSKGPWDSQRIDTQQPQRQLPPAAFAIAPPSRESLRIHTPRTLSCALHALRSHHLQMANESRQHAVGCMPNELENLSARHSARRSDFRDREVDLSTDKTKRKSFLENPSTF